MAERHKILILDDDPAFLELCQELLGTLSSQPDIRTASTGGHAIAMMDSEPFSLLLTDLKMPTMDGFQVLAIVRRRFPNLRTIVMTGDGSDEYRSRAYAVGIDLYVEKPKTPGEIKLFVDCVESMLEREQKGGFRGVQSKSLADIVQMESISQSSTVLKITNGPLVAKIWLDNGELIDAEVSDESGETAFMKAMSWRSGSFETLPADPGRERKIFNSIQGLLLDSAQIEDEVRAGEIPGSGGEKASGTSKLAALGRSPNIEFLVETGHKGKKFEQYACESPDLVARWVRDTANRFSSLGERLKAGKLQYIVALGPQRHAGIIEKNDKYLCAGFKRNLSAGQVIENLKAMMVQWDS